MRRSRWAWPGIRSLAVRLGVLCMVGMALVVVRSLLAADASADLGAGVYPVAYAIKGAKVVAAPGKVFEPGTVVVRRGLIVAVGSDKDVPIPYDAETIDGKGLVVYPGFIDLYTTVGQRAGVERSATGRGRPVDVADAPLIITPADNRRGLTPEFETAGVLELTDALVEPRRRLGFTDFLSAPAGAIATGQSALVTLSGLPRREAVVASPVALHVNLAPPSEPGATGAGPRTETPQQTPGPGPGPGQGRRRGGDGAAAVENPYPRVLMGSIAHFRQAMLDAEHLKKLDAFVAEHGGTQSPYDPALKVLQAARAKKLPVWWEANTRDEIHRALDLAEEFGTTAVIVGGREAGKVVDRLKASKVPVVLRLTVPEEPRVATETEYRKKAVAERDEPLRVQAQRKTKWKEQLATASVLAKEGIPFAFATDGVDRLDTIPANLRQVITAGLKADDALAALTKTAATIAGVNKRLGTIEAGKLGHVVVMTAPFSDEKAKVKYVLVNGLKFEVKPEDATRATAKGAGGRNRPGGRGEVAAKGSPDEDEDDSAPAAKKESRPAAKVAESPAAKQKSAPESQKVADVADVASKGEKKPAEVVKQAETPKKSEAAPKAEAEKKAMAKAEPPKAEAEKKAAPKAEAPPFVDVATELDEDRKPTIHTGGNVLIKDATILTVTKGTIPKGSILVEKGKIKAVGKDLSAPSGVTVIDATGLVAMPGIIDTHSHIAVQGGVNEGSLSVVPEVRVKDVVTGEDIAIYRAIAGGTTTARLLHGSANTVGGQDAVAKLKYGKPGRDLIIRDAHQGVKFALGENVTRAGRRGQGGEAGGARFPTTRMGVESVIERAFEDASVYRADLGRVPEGREGQGDRQVPAHPAAAGRPAARGPGRHPRRLDPDP